MCIAPNMDVIWASCFHKCLKNSVNTAQNSCSIKCISNTLFYSIKPISASDFCSKVFKHFLLELSTFTRRSSLFLALSPTTYLRTVAHWSLEEISWLRLHGNYCLEHNIQLNRGLSLDRKTSWCMEKSVKGRIKHGHLTNASKHF